ncbi:MAG: hypothetical protein ACLSAF_07680 [Intestinimonas sp.]
MNRYRMYLILGSLELPLQVLPEKLAVRAAGRNETAEVLELGEVLLLRGRGLRKVEWEGLPPRVEAPLHGRTAADAHSGGAVYPALPGQKEPVYLRLEGTDLDLNVPFGIEDFSYEERGGEPGDLYYSISSPNGGATPPATSPCPRGRSGRRTGPARQRTPGAAAMRGPGGQPVGHRPAVLRRRDPVAEALRSNRAVVGANPNLIYPGQVLTIP